MKYERSVITMTLFELDYLIHSLGNCTDDTQIETDLKLKQHTLFKER